MVYFFYRQQIAVIEHKKERKTMAAQQKVFGPYRVKNIGSGNGVYEVVDMVDNHSNTWQELRPRKTYLNRRSAISQCYRMNRRWQEELNPDELDLLDYWKQATN